MNINQKIHEARNLCWHEWEGETELICPKCGAMDLVLFYAYGKPTNPTYDKSLQSGMEAARDIAKQLVCIQFTYNDRGEVKCRIGTLGNSVGIAQKEFMKTEAEALANALEVFIDREMVNKNNEI